MKHVEDYDWSSAGLAARGDVFAKASHDWLHGVFSGDCCSQHAWLMVGEVRVDSERNIWQQGVR